MARILALITLVLASTTVTAWSLVVNCDRGQSLNQTLSKLDKHTPVTVFVGGICTEYVQIIGFDGLTLKGLPGATLSQPSTDPGNGLTIHVVLINASRNVTLDGFVVHSRSSALSSIGIGRNSIGIQLHNLTLDGVATYGFIVFEGSQVEMAKVNARNPGYAALGAYDLSDVHVEDCLFEQTTTGAWNAGLDVGSGHVTMQRTTIRNMEVGISIGSGGRVDIQTYNSYYPLSASNDVLIDNPARTNFWGVSVGGGSLLYIGYAKLRINNPGQAGGGNTGGVYVYDGSTLNAGANLVISDSQGQGIFVSNDSHATLAGSSITGSGHGGVVVANLSTIAVGTSNPLTQIIGNGVDLFCDSKSLISGGANITYAVNTCPNLLPGDTEPIP
jgi:hypothetical protein